MARRRLSELERLQHSSAAALDLATRKLALATLRGNARGIELAQQDLAEILGRIQAAADLLGRRRVLLEVQTLTGRAFAERDERDVPFLPNVPFEEALDDILGRYPDAVVGWEAARDAWEEGAFATARGATVRINARIAEILGRAILEGTDQGLAERRIIAALSSGASVGEHDGLGYTRAYAETVFRTAVASAYSAGRKEMARDPNVRRSTTAWRFVTAHDVDVRSNHKAAENLVAHFDDPIWRTLSPPLGYQCRCSLELVPTSTAKRMGVVSSDGAPVPQARPAGAAPDPGFRSGG